MSFSTLHSTFRDRPNALFQIKFIPSSIKHLGCSIPIENAKLQTVIKELKTHENAIFSFRDKFRYYPGDFPNAETYFGASEVNNGDGDWQISGFTTECLQAWEHLFLAGITDLNLSGSDAGTPDFEVGKNVPGSSYNDSLYYYLRSYQSYFNRIGNALVLTSNATGSSAAGGALTPKDAKK